MRKKIAEYEVDVSKVRQRFADMVNVAAYGRGRVLIARRGRILCAMISWDELRRLRELPPERDPEAEAAAILKRAQRITESIMRRREEEGRARRAAAAAASGDESKEVSG